VRAGLTISQTTQHHQLSELLSSLESVVENLNYKSFTLYDILNTVIEEISALLSDTQTEEGGTDDTNR
jgi:translation initiation factor 2B subunit (eIF-2B alpha/beta/delta family)